jgi:formyltetrahydrofolate synthetase
VRPEAPIGGVDALKRRCEGGVRRDHLAALTQRLLRAIAAGAEGPFEIPIRKKVYHASEVVADTAVRKKIEKFQEDGFGNLPICIAKTQYSFSNDPQLRGAPEGHVFNVRDVYLNPGAGLMVVLSGEIMTMPGLPKTPASDNIDIDADGNIVGLA